MRPSSLAYCTDSCCLSGIILPLWARGLLFLSAEKELNAVWAVHTGNQYSGKQWKMREAVDLSISSPKIEVERGKKMAHSSVSRPLEQSTAADPSETPAVGWRDVNQWGCRRSLCVCVCACVPVRQTQLLHCSDPFPVDEFRDGFWVCVRVHLVACEQMVQPLQLFRQADFFLCHFGIVSALPMCM